MATEEQQVLQKHYQAQITTLLQQLDSALAALPTSTQTLSRSLPAAASILGHIEKSSEDSWATLGGCLRIIWQRPGGISPDHVSRHKNGGLQSCSRLLHRVGANKMAVLDDKDRLEAINWISAFRDAALASPTHVATLIVSAAAAARPVKNATQPVEARARSRGGRAALTSSVPKSTLPVEPASKASISAARDVKPIIKVEPADEAPRRTSPTTSTGPALAWAAPLPPPSSAKRSLITDGTAPPLKHADPLPLASPSAITTPLRRKSVSIPPSAAHTRPSPSISDGTTSSAPAAKKRKTTTTTTPSSSPPPPRPEKKSASAERPQRHRKATKKLDEVEESEQMELLSAPSEEERMEVGEAGMVKFPNYSWWPAIILDPLTAPEWTQGHQKLGYYLCKSIPTGGDHRWISPTDIRPLDEKEVNEVIIPAKYDSPPPVSWKQYRADLIEGCLIALDPVKRKEWSEKPTESDLLREGEAGRRAKLRA